MLKIKFILKCFERVLLNQDVSTDKWACPESFFTSDASFYEESKDGFKKVIGVPMEEGPLLFKDSMRNTFVYLIDLSEKYINNPLSLIDEVQNGGIFATDKATVYYLDSFRIDYALKFLDLDEDVRTALNIINKK